MMIWSFIIILPYFIYYVCGKKNDSEPRIVGGEKAEDRKSYPYQVSLRVSNQHFCGGTLIDEKHILSAAHCYMPGEDKPKIYAMFVTAYVGDLKLHEPLSTTQERSIRCIIAHPDYDTTTTANDIALYRVYEAFTFNDHVKPLKLSSVAPITNENCIVSGWGSLGDDNKVMSENLMFVEIAVNDRTSCESMYQDLPSGGFCAGQALAFKGPCIGDSGGPLVCDGKTILKGIVSYGKDAKCGFAPAVFTDVSQYLKWIESAKESWCPWETWEIVVLIVSLIILVLIIILIYWLSKKFCCD